MNIEWNLERVRAVKKREGRTDEWLAEFCGFAGEKGLKNFKHYLSGRRKPSRTLVKLLAMALNTTEEFLRSQEPPPPCEREVKAAS